jgi:hypothetical protein
MKRLGFTAPIVDKASLLESIYVKLSPEEILDIFVSESINPEGQKVPENLWFFSKSYMMEAHNFPSAVHIDFTPHASISYTVFDAQDYDFQTPQPSSRLTVQLRLNEIAGVLKASGENCNVLRDIGTKYLLPR